MNRQGLALAAALLVVLLGGILVAGSVTWAVAELRAGSSWSFRARSEAAARSGLIDMLPDLHAWLDSAAVGDTLTALHDSGGSVVSVRALVLGDSVLHLHTVSTYRDSEARLGLILRLTPDSMGLRPFGVAPRYHPLP